MLYFVMIGIFLIGVVLKNSFMLRNMSYSDEYVTDRIAKREKGWVFFFFTICALVMGFRAVTVGEDTERYCDYFNYIASLSFNEIHLGSLDTGLDFGYVLLMKIISLICNNYIFFQVLESLFICIGYAFYILKNRIDTSVGIAVFLGNGLFFAAFNTARQSIAITILLFAWTLLQEKKYVKAAVLIIIASSIHLSAILFLIPVIIFVFRKHEFIYWLFPCMLVIAMVFYENLLTIAAALFPRYSHITSNSNQYMSIGFSVVVWVIIAVISLIILYRRNNTQITERISAVCALLYSIFSCFGLFVNSFERLGFYFIPFIPVVIESFEKIFYGFFEKFGLYFVPYTTVAMDSLGKKQLIWKRSLYRLVVCGLYLCWFIMASTHYPYVFS